jgi:hypothetical protein
LAAFEGFRRSAFKTTTILSAFQKTGIVPHNPQRVIAFLEKKQAANQPEDTEEEEEDIQADSDEPITPQTVSELHKVDRSFLQQLEEAAQLSPSVKQNFNRYLKGVTTRLDFGAQIEEDYTQSEAAQKARKKRQTPSQRQISGGGYTQCRRSTSSHQAAPHWRREGGNSSDEKAWKTSPQAVFRPISIGSDFG